MIVFDNSSKVIILYYENGEIPIDSRIKRRY